MTPEQNQATLFKKLTEVLQAVGKVKKTGLNTHQGYQYATEADILEAAREQLAKHNLFIFTSVEEYKIDLDAIKTRNSSQHLTTVKLKHTFVDGETGATFEVYSHGQGTDGQDKGIYKAITGAMKYFMMKNFLMATEDDPESSSANASYVRPNSKSNSNGSGKGMFGSAPKKSVEKTVQVQDGGPTEVGVKEEKTSSRPMFGTNKPQVSFGKGQ